MRAFGATSAITVGCNEVALLRRLDSVAPGDQAPFLLPNLDVAEDGLHRPSLTTGPMFAFPVGSPTFSSGTFSRSRSTKAS